MSAHFYVFENGSGSTWAKYIVPADAYQVYVNQDGKLGLTPVVPASVYFTSVKKESLRVILAEELGNEVAKLRAGLVDG